MSGNIPFARTKMENFEGADRGKGDSTDFVRGGGGPQNLRKSGKLERSGVGETGILNFSNRPRIPSGGWWPFFEKSPSKGRGEKLA